MRVDRTSAWRPQSYGPSTARSSYHDRWRLLSAEHRRAVARPASRVRPQFHGMEAPRQVERRWPSGGDARSRAWAGRTRRPTLMRRQYIGANCQVCRRGWEKDDTQEPADHAIGCSRSGLSSKIHVLCDGQGYRLHLQMTAGQAHEAVTLETLLIGADKALYEEYNDPMAWPVALAGDKGYRADWIDGYLLDLTIQPVFTPNANENRGAGPAEFKRQAYHDRNIIGHLTGRLLLRCHSIEYPRFAKACESGQIGYMGVQRNDAGVITECRCIFSRFENVAKNFASIICMEFVQRHLERAIGFQTEPSVRSRLTQAYLDSGKA